MKGNEMKGNEGFKQDNQTKDNQTGQSNKGQSNRQWWPSGNTTANEQCTSSNNTGYEYTGRRSTKEAQPLFKPARHNLLNLQHRKVQ
jgi:hypothetical protein